MRSEVPCLEYGVMLAPGAARVRAALCAAIAEGENEFTASSRECLQDLYEELVDVEARVRHLNTKIRQLTFTCEIDGGQCRIRLIDG